MSHYQLSFTTRQALLLFVTFLLALAFAYFLGLMTGLAGRRAERAAASPTPRAAEAPSVSAGASPSRSVRAIAPRTPVVPAASGAAEPTAARLELFEDRSGEEPTPAVAARSAGAAGKFWVQVMSVSSEREARLQSRKLFSRGYHVTVEPASGPKGTVFRVRVGPYGSREEASRVAERLSREEKAKAWIVPAGK